MLYFSKLKLVTIYSIIFILSLFTLTNFSENEDNFLLSKKVNLGLDLQGGSYLLLEVDTAPVFKEKLQDKLISLRKIFKDKKIKYKNLSINDNSINFTLNESDTQSFEDFFLSRVTFFYYFLLSP